MPAEWAKSTEPATHRSAEMRPSRSCPRPFPGTKIDCGALSRKRAAATLNHPNILAIFDIGMQDGSPYIVSELLEARLPELSSSVLPCGYRGFVRPYLCGRSGSRPVPHR